jgi:hemerythrin-like metal-binding protein
MAIIWRNSMSVGNDLIDHDHHFMMNFINTIELLLQNPEENDKLLEVFKQVREYLINHFRTEESILRKIEYPKSIQHKHAHNKLINELDKLSKDLDNAKSPEEIIKKSQDIKSFFWNWLINHVLTEDLLLKPYLEKLPRGFY